MEVKWLYFQQKCYVYLHYMYICTMQNSPCSLVILVLLWLAVRYLMSCSHCFMYSSLTFPSTLFIFYFLMNKCVKVHTSMFCHTHSPAFIYLSQNAPHKYLQYTLPYVVISVLRSISLLKASLTWKTKLVTSNETHCI